MSKSTTTIKISTELRDKLKELGKKGETYEEVIERVLKLANIDKDGNTQ
jgi:transcriptional regulator